MLCLAPGLKAATLVPTPQGSAAPINRRATVSFWSASAHAHVARTRGRLRRRARFLARAVAQPGLTRAWLARLVQPDAAPLWAARPRLALKLQRPYVCCAWDSATRLAALLGHYEILSQVFAPEARMAIYGNGVDLVRITHAETRARWDIQLFYHDRFEREGELTLAVREVGTGVMLAGLTFCLAHNDGERFAVIGGLQGSGDPRALGLIHAATKGLCGMRPKALLLWCLQQLAQPWRLAQIQAVGDSQHVWRHWMKRVEIAASYDDFWLESDGRRLPGEGGWELPLRFNARPRRELKPSRRKTHERRYAMLDALRPRLLSALAALSPNGQASAMRAEAPGEFVCPPRDGTAHTHGSLLGSQHPPVERHSPLARAV